MDKYERITVLHRLLHHARSPLSQSTILEKLECSQATFYRILAYMRDVLGAPVVFDSRYNGYRYDDSADAPFELPGLWFTRPELEALLCFDATVEALQPGFFRNLLEPFRKRLEQLLKKQRTGIATLRSRIKILSHQNRPIDEEIFRITVNAVLRKKALSITHEKLTADAATARIVSPQALVRYRDNWYLDAWCHARRDLRTFALARICKAQYAQVQFHFVPEVERDRFFATSYGIFTGRPDKTAVIDFSGPAAREVSTEQWHPNQKGDWVDSETYRLSIPYRHDKELIMDILRWGRMATVISPPSLCLHIREEIMAMQKNMEK